MRRLLCALAALVAMPAAAQVYKCTTNGVTSYSEIPCGDKPRAVDLNVHHPSRSEQAAARQRALIDKHDARVLGQQQAQEREREAAERRIAQRQAAYQEAAAKAKCDGYERTAKAAGHEKDLYLTQRFRDDAERRKREAEAQHFSECYGVR